MFRTFLSFLFLVSSATAFVTNNANSMRTPTMQLQGMAFGEKVSILAGREFQLEEKEDREVEQTRIWLNPDGTVTLQDTDGPKFVAYEGRWSMVDEVNPFRMLLDRVYGGGMKARSSTDIGEFDYTVRREFVGDIQMIGSTVNVEGVVHLLDIENGQRNFEVGYFALIDSGFELEK